MIEVVNSNNLVTLVKILVAIVSSEKVIKYIAKYINKRKEIKAVKNKNSIDVKMDIDYLLTDLLHMSNADRAYVCIFHNGTSSNTGIHFDKMSMRYEVLREGFSPEKHNFQNLSLDDYSQKIDYLLKNKFKIVRNTSLIHEISLRDIYLKKGVKSYYITLVKDKKKKPDLICLLGIEYVKHINNEDYLLEKDILTELDYYANRVAYRLTDNKSFLS